MIDSSPEYMKGLRDRLAIAALNAILQRDHTITLGEAGRKAWRAADAAIAAREDGQ